MKVLRIIARLNVGGPARHVAWLEAGLRVRGVESLLVAGVVPPGEDDMGYFAERLGVRPHVIPEMSREVSPKDAVTVWKLYRLMLRERPDVVHTHTAKAGTVGRVAGAALSLADALGARGTPARVPLRPHVPRPHLPQLLRPLEDAPLPRRRAGAARTSPTASSSSARSSSTR